MNDQPILTPPEQPDEQTEKWESTVRDTARHFVYPPTPDIAGSVRARLKPQSRRGLGHGLRLAAAALLALAVVTLAVPQTRAFVLEVLRIGVVRIFFVEPTATPTLSLTETPVVSSANDETAIPKPTRTPRPTTVPPFTPVASPLDLPGATTLAAAEQLLGTAILLPRYPANLGAPDRVFAQELGGGTVVTLVWLKPDDSTQVDLTMQILNDRLVAAKYFPWEDRNEQHVIVNGRSALWLTNIHRIYFYETDGEVSRIVDKNVLLWAIDPLTYRLETDHSLEEAIRIAESLR